jgi:hypothetical protein
MGLYNAIKKALEAVGVAKSSDVQATQPRNIAQWGGTALTGRDISADLAMLQNLDLKITALRDALKGANNKDFSTLEADVHQSK